jgi:hypothetical protein
MPLVVFRKLNEKFHSFQLQKFQRVYKINPPILLYTFTKASHSASLLQERLAESPRKLYLHDSLLSFNLHSLHILLSHHHRLLPSFFLYEFIQLSLLKSRPE